MSTATEKLIDEWSLEGVLRELAKFHNTMDDRQFAFILGAGASAASGIPTGHSLAQQWLQEIYECECLDKEFDLDAWLENDQSGWKEKAIKLEDAGSHYPTIFERRFKGDREAGYAALETVMEGKLPSIGYSLLACIIHHTRHKVVITTNFDNLVADALSMQAHQSPLIVAHESLAGFVRPKMRRPLIAKIHRDLFLNPINDENGVSKLEESWKIALKKLFQYFTPIIIGYGGNDGSLMNMLQDLNNDEISGRMFWCYRGDKNNIPIKVLEVLSKHNGVLVKIPSFDELMIQLAQKLVPDLSVDEIPNSLKALAAKRAEHYQEQLEKLAKETTLDKETASALKDSVSRGRSWWAWQLKANEEQNFEKRDAIYREGLKDLPRSSELCENYAFFLTKFLKNHDAAETFYKKAIELDPNNAHVYNSYANLLNEIFKKYDDAEANYKRAIALAPNDARAYGNYALFLTTIRKNHDAAEIHFKKAIEINPNYALAYDNYANLLKNVRKNYNAAEANYRKAIELDPNYASAYGNYANLLWDINKNYAAAETHYKKAIELDPNNGNFHDNYAVFLLENHKDHDAAEAHFKKAIELDPDDANAYGNYANLLNDIHNNYDAAEANFKKAIKLDPSYAQAYNNYANLLKEIRKDYDTAEAHYRKSIELEPNKSFAYINYALFLIEIRNDYNAAEALLKKAIELDPHDENTLANYTYIILCKNNYVSAQSVTEQTICIVKLSKHRINQALAEALFYGSLAFELSPPKGNSNMLPSLKYILTQSFQRGKWTFEHLFDCLLPSLSTPKQIFYRALGEAILDESKVEALGLFTEWKEIIPINPFEYFEKL